MDLDRDLNPDLNLLPSAPVPHLPAFMDASAAGMLRASAHSNAIPCSAAATVLAVGALTTRQPHCRDREGTRGGGESWIRRWSWV